jgi:hypothetical protein
MDARSMEGPPLHLSSIVELYPGDLIFTGTPGGVGFGRSPQQYLVPGDELISSIEGLGEIRQTFVSRSQASPNSPHREKEGSLASVTLTRRATEGKLLPTVVLLVRVVT